MEGLTADSPSAPGKVAPNYSAQPIRASILPAQAQQETTKEMDRQKLLKVKPDLGGFRSGVFIEPDPIDFADHAGYISLFDGKTLTAWDGHPDIWRVENGLIVGETRAEPLSPHFSKYLSCLPRNRGQGLRSKARNQVRERRRKRHSVPKQYRESNQKCARRGRRPARSALVDDRPAS